MNIQTILAIVISILTGAIVGWNLAEYFKNFSKKDRDEKLQIIKNWLLVAIAEAEKIYGAKTGSLKLAYVYDLFIQRMPELAESISFDTFSSLVDDVLNVFKKMLNDNKAVKTYVETKPIVLESAGTPEILPVNLETIEK